MTTYRNEGGNFIIEGVKKDRIGQFAVGASVQLVKDDTGLLYGETTTKIGGHWLLTIPEANLPSGNYVVQFSGSRLVPLPAPDGDWELLDIMGTDLFDPIQPADIEGLLRTETTVIDATTVLVTYAVACNATRVAITNESLVTMSGVALDYIDQHKDTILTPDNYDPAYRLVFPGWIRTPDTDTIAAGQTIIYDLTTGIISDAYKVKLHGTGLDKTGLRFKITTRLAADEIDAGRLRVEKGISISANGVSGFVIDTQSLRGKNGSGQTVVALYNDVQTIAGISGVYAKLGGWAISDDSILHQETNSWIGIVGAADPYIGVGTDSTHQFARLGYLGTVSSVKKNGIWATLGGFGGTDYTNAPVLINSDGLIIKDTNSVTRALLHIPATGDWKTPDQTQKTATDQASGCQFNYTAGNGPSNWTSGATGSPPHGSWPSGSPGSVHDFGMTDDDVFTIYMQYSTSNYFRKSFTISGATAGMAISFKCYIKKDVKANSSCTITIAQGETWAGATTLITTSPDVTGSGGEKINQWQLVQISTMLISADDVWINFNLTSGENSYYAFDTMAIYSEEYFTEINQNGIYIYNSAGAYMRVGKSVAEFVFPTITLNNLTVTGHFVMAGTQVTTGPSIQVNPTHVLNNGGGSYTYGGLEIDNTSGIPQSLVYTSGRWQLGHRSSGAVGDQSGLTFSGPNEGNILTANSADSLTNKNWTGGTVDATSLKRGGVEVNTVYRETYILGGANPSYINNGTAIAIPSSRSYIIGSNRLLVYVDGILQMVGSGTANDYAETSTTQVTFNYDLSAPAAITFILLGW